VTTLSKIPLTSIADEQRIYSTPLTRLMALRARSMILIPARALEAEVEVDATEGCWAGQPCRLERRLGAGRRKGVRCTREGRIGWAWRGGRRGFSYYQRGLKSKGG